MLFRIIISIFATRNLKEMKKNYRRSAILEILTSRRIHTQDELLVALNEKGINVTQATLSRDVKDMGAYKVSDPSGETYYKIPENRQQSHYSGSVKSIEVSDQLCVIHCKPGYASALASMIDGSSIQGVLGTIAGDDTIFVALKGHCDEDEIRKSIKSIL